MHWEETKRADRRNVLVQWGVVIGALLALAAILVACAPITLYGSLAPRLTNGIMPTPAT